MEIVGVIGKKVMDHFSVRGIICECRMGMRAVLSMKGVCRANNKQP